MIDINMVDLVNVDLLDSAMGSKDYESDFQYMDIEFGDFVTI